MSTKDAKVCIRLAAEGRRKAVETVTDVVVDDRLDSGATRPWLSERDEIWVDGGSPPSCEGIFTGISNGPPEGYNRVVKDIGMTATGFRT